MSIPNKIPITRYEDYYTHHIGRYGDGNQFMGFVVATLSPLPNFESWKQYKRWYAVLYLFDEEGKYIDAKYEFFGSTADGEGEVVTRARDKLNEWLNDLPSKEFDNVQIELFNIKIDGHIFGLINASEPDEDYEAIHLVPNDLAFCAPWNGEYDT